MTTRFADKETIKELESLRKQNLEQAAQIAMLQRALESCRPVMEAYCLDTTRLVLFARGLSTTPSQALEAFAAKVREQCVEKIAMQKHSAPRYAEELNWNAGVGAAIVTIKGIKELP